MDLGFKLILSNRNLKHPTSRQIFGDTSGLLCKKDLILRHMLFVKMALLWVKTIINKNICCVSSSHEIFDLSFYVWGSTRPNWFAIVLNSLNSSAFHVFFATCIFSSPNIYWKWNWSNIECQIFCLKKIIYSENGSKRKHISEIPLGVIHVLRNHFWGSRQTPPPLCM